MNLKIKSSGIAKAGVITGVFHKNVNLEEESQIITKSLGFTVWEQLISVHNPSTIF